MIVEDGNLRILEVFARTIRLMSEGELLQLHRSFDSSVTESHYYDVIDRKSAALLAASCETGAILAEVTRAEQRQVSEFGRELGLAFQLKDDALDYEAGAAALGKEPFADLREGKVTLPLLLTLKRCTSNERELISGVLKSAAQQAAASLVGDDDASLHPTADSTPDSNNTAKGALSTELQSVQELVDRYRGVQDTNRRADEHVARASTAIAAFPDGLPKQSLLSAAAFAVSRDR
jgi:octaprenyl-diphosphate synthase